MTPPQEHAEALSGSGGVVHLLSFDVEEYFQVEAAAGSGVRREDWKGFATRLTPSVDRVLQALADTHDTAWALDVLAETGYGRP